MALHSNIVEVLLDRAVAQADDRAYVFLADGETEGAILTYGDLDAQSRAVAVEIRCRVELGDRVILLYRPGPEFIVAFLACQLAGVVAVPVYPPRRPEEWSRFAAIARDCDAKAVCTHAAHLEALQTGLASIPELSKIAVVASDAVDRRGASQWTMPALSPESLAFLQYTSGSTGTPKGVMVSHRNLLHNEGLIQCGFESHRGTVAVSWLPQYHDMGLIGSILQPLYLGASCVLMSPFHFLQRPLRWLKAITKYRGTSSGAPNFAYDLCTSRVTDEAMGELDLSCWRVAFNGAEPVRLGTLERFADKFAPCGFRRASFFPCYGLAEATLFVSGAPVDSFPRALHFDAAALERHDVVLAAPESAGSRALVACGKPQGQAVRIVDPSTLAACADGQVGEIWIQGQSVARGYWNRPDATRETFDARLADRDEGPFLRTGDLGVLHEGELFVTGRLKELIIVDGKNHYPHDIEETVQSERPALRSGCGAAFSVDVDGAERLVVVQEVAKVRPDLDLAALATEIRGQVTERHGIALHAIVFLRPGDVHKTSSGKIRRRRMRERYLDGSLQEIFRSDGVIAPSRAAQAAPARASSSETERLIAALVASKVGLAIAEIDVHLPFSAYGLDSRALVGLSGELEALLGRKLEPQLFYNYSTVAALSAFLSGERREAEVAREAPRAHEPIAIVGMACRFPGAPDLDAFWQLLTSGRDAITQVPPGRWDANHWFDPDPSAPGKMATRWGGFVDDVDRFDADFFGISPREAEAMDPQQRIVLELAWHALENAGVRADALRGSRTGVFIGISGNDYARLQAGTSGLLSAHAGTGNALSIVANRLSYFLDLRGPSMAIDTACSSSLTAVHEAAVHLLAGDCDIALVGGINLALAPDVTVSFSQNRMMAADGRCKSFSKDADGYVRAEGAGLVVLKRLSEAVAAGDRIFAVIPASACNQDGRSNGLTAPSGLAQQAVIRDALHKAGWRPTDVQLVETHGTGTRLGDPIEAEALGAVYGQGRSGESALVLGAVKSQIGHLEAAAGIAGLIKTALCLSHRTIVANLHNEHANPLIRMNEWHLALPRDRRPWPNGVPRRAGVSAFGFGGTNAHVLLEEAPARAASESRAAATPIHLLAFSARSQTSLEALSQSYMARLSYPNVDAAALCHAATTQRRHFREARRAVVGTNAEALAAALARATPERDEERTAPAKRGVVFLFTGQGAQYVNMGRRLYETCSDFRAILDSCDEALRGARAHGLVETLYPAPERAREMDALLASSDYTQPALFSLEVALAKLWLSWGVHPAAVMGHSLGEFAAATIAGVFTLEDGLKLVEARGRLMKALPEAGGMLAVFAHEKDLEELLSRFAGRLSIGAYNGPGQMVLSGALRPLEKARLMLKERGIEAKPLNVSHAFHSPLMQPMVDEFRRVAETVRYHEPRIPVISNLTGHGETARLASADYWVEHVLAPVRFAHGVESLKHQNVGVLLEIGPRPVLVGMARRMLSASEYLFQPSLDFGKDDWQSLGGSVAALYEAGIDIDWDAFAAPFAPSVRGEAPLYPFEPKRYWFDAKRLGTSSASASPGAHPLLGRALSSPRRRSGERHFEAEVRCPGPAFHRLPIEPAERRVSLLAYLEIALAAQHEIFPDRPRHVRGLVLDGLLRVGRDETCTVQTLCDPDGEDTYRMEVWAKEEPSKDDWRRVAHAELRGSADSALMAEPLASLRARIQAPIDVDALYESTREAGLQYCVSPYPAIHRLWWAPGEVLADVTPREEDDVACSESWLKHSMWNACNQVFGALAPRDGHGTYFPVALHAVRFVGQPGRALVMHARMREEESDSPTCVVDVTAYAEDGTPVAAVEGVRFIPDEAMRSPRATWQKTAIDERPLFLADSLRRLVARTFKRPADEIPLQQPLTALGLDSLTAMDIVTRVEQLFEVGVNLACLHEGASIEKLVAILGDELTLAEGSNRRAGAGNSTVIELNRGDSSLTPLFLLHPIGGSVFCYQELARHLGAQPVIALQSPSLAGSNEVFPSLEALAAHYVSLVRGRQAHGPYRLGGWSMGGVLAFEMARQLEAAGEQIECLILLDAMARGTVPASPTQGYVLSLMAQGLSIDLGALTEDDLQGHIDAAVDRVMECARAQGHSLRSLTHADFRRLLAEYERHLALLGAYVGQAYKGTATVLRAEIPLFANYPQASGRDWERWLAGIDALHTVPGDHFNLLTGSHVILTASYVRKTLKGLNPKNAEARPEAPLALPKNRAERNIVIAAPERGQDGLVRARLVVDEGHNFFFDHPLDHVSGILMLEGLLQLIESADVTGESFIRHLRLTFPRFCEKDRPTVLELGAATDGDTRSARAVQDGLPVCVMRFHTDHGPSAASRRALSMPPSPDAPSAQANAKLLHKARTGNVMIGAWRVAEGVAHTTLLAPPSGHQLEGGDRQHYSPLYALEAVRQLVTGLAHAEYGVPLGMPMNLVGVELVLDAPLARSAPLSLRHALKPLPPAGSNTFAHFEMDILAYGEVLGHCKLTAQLLTKEAYLLVRHRHQKAAAA